MGFLAATGHFAFLFPENLLQFLYFFRRGVFGGDMRHFRFDDLAEKERCR